MIVNYHEFIMVNDNWCKTMIVDYHDHELIQVYDRGLPRSWNFGMEKLRSWYTTIVHIFHTTIVSSTIMNTCRLMIVQRPRLWDFNREQNNLWSWVPWSCAHATFKPECHDHDLMQTSIVDVTWVSCEHHDRAQKVTIVNITLGSRGCLDRDWLGWWSWD